MLEVQTFLIISRVPFQDFCQAIKAAAFLEKNAFFELLPLGDKNRQLV